MAAQMGLVVFSALAFVVSLISLWRSILAPFKLKISYNSPTFTIHKISPEISGGSKTWWIPSIDMDFTFFNLGKRAGEIIDIRFSGKIDTGDIERVFIFYAKWIVDFRKFNQNRDNRLKWLETSIIRDWYPMVLVGDEQKHLHIVFEGLRWDKKFIGKLNLSLDVFSSDNTQWENHEKFELSITPEIYDNTFTISLSNQKLGETRTDFFKQWDNF